MNRIAACCLVSIGILAHMSPLSAQVLTGIDVLQRDNFQMLAGRRIGLITNHTGTNLDNVSTVKLLYQANNVDLVALFSPEHGFAGKLDQSHIGDQTDPNTGLKVHSLYGETRVPTAEMVEGLDALVFDIQDIGTRFYTYISTMGGAMKVAAEHDLEFFVLDRPNPIDGVTVQGPILDDGSQSFVGYHTIAVRHGMTIGELAMMFRDEMELELKLTVVSLQGWKRSDRFDRTERLWSNPSPNMRSLTEALLYPGVGLIETTNVSVGRGTDTPFEVLGAPWIDARAFAKKLNAERLPGVRFVPVEFTPRSSKHAEQVCGGVNLVVTDWGSFHPLRTGMLLATTLRQMYPEDWQTKYLNRLLSCERVRDGILAGRSVDQLQETWRQELDQFKQRRAKYLIYN